MSREPKSIALRALLAFTLTGSAACGGGDGGAVPEELTRIDPCGLLTMAEVEAALGPGVEEPFRQESEAGYVPEGAVRPLTTLCNWSGEWPNVIGLTVRQSGPGGRTVTSAEMAAELNESLESAAQDPDRAEFVGTARWEPVDLPGHAAAALAVEEAGWTILVRQDGRRGVEVMLSVAERQTGVDLTRTVVSRLP